MFENIFGLESNMHHLKHAGLEGYLVEGDMRKTFGVVCTRLVADALDQACGNAPVDKEDVPLSAPRNHSLKDTPERF